MGESPKKLKNQLRVEIGHVRLFYFRRGFHLGAPTNISLQQNQCYTKYTGKSLPESFVGLIVTLCTDWILNKHIKTIIVAHKSQKKQKL